MLAASVQASGTQHDLNAVGLLTTISTYFFYLYRCSANNHNFLTMETLSVCCSAAVLVPNVCIKVDDSTARIGQVTK